MSCLMLAEMALQALCAGAPGLCSQTAPHQVVGLWLAGIDKFGTSLLALLSCHDKVFVFQLSGSYNALLNDSFAPGVLDKSHCLAESAFHVTLECEIHQASV